VVVVVAAAAEFYQSLLKVEMKLLHGPLREEKVGLLHLSENEVGMNTEMEVQYNVKVVVEVEV
jgi:hypothetical protein